MTLMTKTTAAKATKTTTTNLTNIAAVLSTNDLFDAASEALEHGRLSHAETLVALLSARSDLRDCLHPYSATWALRDAVKAVNAKVRTRFYS